MNVNFKGISTVGGEVNVSDGVCSDLINATVNEFGEIKAMSDLVNVGSIPLSETIRYRHKGFDFECLITEYDADYLKSYNIDNGVNGDYKIVETTTRFPRVESTSVVSISHVGNTLILSLDGELNYYIHTNGGYISLGTIPDCADIRISIIQDYNYKESDHYKFTPNDNKTRSAAIYAALYESIGKVYEEGSIAFACLLRYAYRLSDGSHVGFSNPVIITGEDNYNTRILLKYSNDGGLSVMSKGFRPYMAIMDNGNLEKWSDIIVGVDVFITKELDFIIHNLESITDIPFDYINVQDSIDNLRSFHKIHHFSLFQLTEIGPDDELNWYKIKIEDIRNLHQMEALKESSNSNHDILGNGMYLFNDRIHLFESKRRLHHGYDLLRYRYDSNIDGLDYNDTTFKEASISTKIKISGSIDNVVTLKKTNNDVCISVNPMLSYPDHRAKSLEIVYVTKSGASYKATIPLKRHPNFNFSYYVNTEYYNSIDVEGNNKDLFRFKDGLYGRMDQAEYNTVQSKTIIETFPSKLYVSNIASPFSFDLESVVSVGSGKILCIVSSSTPVSQGQFGQYPLYVFTTDGIWALSVDDQGRYYSKQPVSREIINTSHSIAIIDVGVLFYTDKGLYIINGSEVQFLSSSLYDRDSVVIDPPSNISSQIDICRIHFFDFLKKNPRPLYDHCNSRVLFVADGERCIWVLNISNMQFSKILSKRTYYNGLNYYPSFFIESVQNKLNCIYEPIPDINYNDEIDVIAVTRSVKLGTLDHKRIRKIRLRSGNKVSLSVYGSRNFKKYHRLHSSLAAPMQSFIFAMSAKMRTSDEISALDIQYIPISRSDSK